MKTNQWMSVTAAVAVSFCLSGCARDRQSDPVAADRARPEPATGRAVFEPGSPQLKQIRTETVPAAMVPAGSVTAPGKVELNTNRLSHVILPVPGRVATVSVKTGDFVRQGQPLLEVESADADAAVSGYRQANASVTQAKSALAKAQRDLDREKDLFEHGAVPQKDVLNAEAVMVQARAAVEQAEAAAGQALRRLEILGVGTGSFGQRVTVSAPLSGKVLEMSVVRGEFRNDLSAPVMTIADLSSVWVTSDVPETAIRFIKPGEPAAIELTAYPGSTFRGRVTLIGDTVDPQTRTVKVRAELTNSDGRLKPEMFGNIQLAEQMELRPTVPAGAIVSAEGRAFVWREVGNATFERVAVTAGPQADGRVAVLDGLNAGDRIVADGVMLLTAGQGSTR